MRKIDHVHQNQKSTEQVDSIMRDMIIRSNKIATAVLGLGGFASIVLLAKFSSPLFAAGVGAIVALAGMFTRSIRG